MLFITVCLLFSSPRSSLNISCIFSILFLRFWIIFTVITLNSFSGRLPISSSLFGLVGFYLCPSSVTYFFSFFFVCFLMGGVVFLSYWLFGLRCPAPEFAGSWIELGLGAEMRTFGRSHSD